MFRHCLHESCCTNNIVLIVHHWKFHALSHRLQCSKMDNSIIPTIWAQRSVVDCIIKDTSWLRMLLQVRTFPKQTGCPCLPCLWDPATSNHTHTLWRIDSLRPHAFDTSQLQSLTFFQTVIFKNPASTNCGSFNQIYSHTSWNLIQSALSPANSFILLNASRRELWKLSMIVTLHPASSSRSTVWLPYCTDTNARKVKSTPSPLQPYPDPDQRYCLL